jgi:hypothetical protein
MTFENVIPSGQRTTTQCGVKKLRRPFWRHASVQKTLTSAASSSNTRSATIKGRQGEGSRTFLTAGKAEALATADQ